jgi:hypothetical protein
VGSGQLGTVGSGQLGIVGSGQWAQWAVGTYLCRRTGDRLVARGSTKESVSPIPTADKCTPRAGAGGGGPKTDAVADGAGLYA